MTTTVPTAAGLVANEHSVGAELVALFAALRWPHHQTASGCPNQIAYNRHRIKLVAYVSRS